MKSDCSLLWLIQKVKRHRKSKHVETLPWHPVQPSIPKFLVIFFLSEKRALLFTISALLKIPPPKKNDCSKWRTKSYKGDHIKDELAEDHANTRWRCCLAEMLLQPSMTSSSYSTSRWCAVHVGVQFLSSPNGLPLVPECRSPIDGCPILKPVVG